MVVYITELGDVNYKNFISSNQYVLIDVWAEWCQPCKQLSPLVDEISVDFLGKVTVGKLDADANKDSIIELGIRNIPALLFYKNGELVDKLVGMKSKGDIADMINRNL